MKNSSASKTPFRALPISNCNSARDDRRLTLLGFQFSAIDPPQPTHYPTGRANFRGGGGVMTFQLDESDKRRLLPAVSLFGPMFPHRQR